MNVGAKISIGTLFLCLCIYIGSLVGAHQERYKWIQRAAVVKLDLLYLSSKVGEKEVVNAVATDIALEEMADLEKQLGPVKSWTLVRQTSGPFGLPCSILVKVQRKTESMEIVTLHSPKTIHTVSLADRESIRSIFGD